MGEQGGLDQKGSKIPCPPGAPLYFPPQILLLPTTSPWPPSWWWTLPGFQDPRHQGKDRAATLRSCATITLMSACSSFYQRTFVSALERFGRYGWAGLGLLVLILHFSFMLSGPALIKTDSRPHCWGLCSSPCPLCLPWPPTVPELGASQAHCSHS